MGWSIEAQNDFLAGMFGTTRGSQAPDVLEFAYAAGDPFNGGAEITDGGHERVEWSADDWTAPEDGRTFGDGLITFPVPSAAYPDTATHWVAFKVGESEPYMAFALDDAVDITSAGGSAPTLIPRVQTPDAVIGG
jgi:hypothetical protein